MTDSKWRVVRSASVVKDRWIDLRADDCVTPAGVEIKPYYVLTYSEWVHVVALTAGNRVVLVRQYRHAAGEMILELPGGMVDRADGDLEQAARRELLEETGYTAPSWEHVTSLYPNPATHTNRVHFYLAQDAVCTRSQSLDEGEAGMQVELPDIQAVVSGLRSGLIGQAMHVAGLLLALQASGKIEIK